MSSSPEVARPEPDALLERARDGRGRLKVYLGMAPGVGKTSAMLESARRLAADGIDVAVGLVETHGRRETEALLDGLEVLPRRRTESRGQALRDFDLDGALRRRPALLLVDELAHTNPPDARHPKRWQDIEELLDAGIDVHTTVNIQHVETLNDIVARITGVRVRETVPDRVLETADEVELVDLTPGDLVARLEQGKVYTADLVGTARNSFFTPGNLAALRELALRHTADRVDADVVGYMRRRAIAGPWPAGERVLVAVGGSGDGESVVREGRRVADLWKARWTVVHVEVPGADPGAGQGRIRDAMSLAERLEARTETLHGSDPVQALLEFARRHNFTQLVVGQPSARRRRGWRAGFAERLLAANHGLSIHFAPTPVEGRGHRKSSLAPAPRARVQPRAIAVATAGVAAVSLLGLAFPLVGGLSNVAMLYLVAVLASAVIDGPWAAVLTAVLAALASNFFFTSPRWTLLVADGRDVIALLIFLAVGITTGLMAGRIRQQARASEGRVNALGTLYDFSRRLGASRTEDALLHAVVLQAWRLASRDAMMLLPREHGLAIRYAWPPRDRLDEAAWAAARWTMERGEPAGARTDTLPSCAWHFRPLRTGDRTTGVFGILADPSSPPPPEFLQAMDAMLDQTAVALDRLAFAAEASRAEAMEETERFRSALLSSVSHDLRTPLTSILGSVTALRSAPDRLGPAARDELLATIEEEAERLDRFVRNLLDMTRIESGTLEARRDWLAPAEVIDEACARFEGHLGHRRLVRAMAPGLPLLRADFVLLETVLVNLLDNFARHAAKATFVEVGVRRDGPELLLWVLDDGDGVPPEHLPRLFERFFRVRGADAAEREETTGLGLSICRGLVEAMGGRIEAGSPAAEGRGLRFTMRFPIEPQPSALDEAPVKCEGGNAA